MGPPSILINSILCLFVYVSLVLSVSLSLSVSGFLSFFLLAWKKFAYLHLSCGASLSLYNFHPVSLCISLSLNFFLSIGIKKDCIPAFKLWGLNLSLYNIHASRRFHNLWSFSLRREGFSSRDEAVPRGRCVAACAAVRLCCCFGSTCTKLGTILAVYL